MRIQSYVPPLRLRAPKQDQDWQDAGRLMAERGIPADGHQFMQENLATYLSHRSGSGELSERWQSKLDRELQKPFTDLQVSERVEYLQQSLLENLSELPSYPSQVYLTGSFSRGRLGGNSDLDGYATLRPEDMSAGFDCFEKRVESDGSCLFPTSSERPGFNRANLLYAGASVEVDPARLSEPGYLRKTYQHVLDNRPEERRETAALYEWATGKMWGEGLSASKKREQFEGKTFKSRLMNAALSMGGTLSMVPLVGPVVRKVADLCVNQSHLGPPPERN
jgi:hypothetical protein